MDIFLVRHGEAAATWSESADPGLSKLGQHEAAATAALLNGMITPDTLLLSSPLQRAIETAAPLAGLLGQKVEIDDAFREIPSPVPLAERQSWLLQFMQQDWDEQSSELKAWRDRAMKQLLVLKTPAVVFTHFLVINAVVGTLLSRPQTLCFRPANASITQLRVSGRTLEVVSLGPEMESFVN